jgi:hypothetical protein
MDEHYGIDGGAALGGCLVVLIVIGLLVGLVFGAQALGSLADAEAQRSLAEAQLERARSDREHQRAVDWQREFMLWTAYIEANDLDLLVIVVIGLMSLAFGFLLGNRPVL